MDTVLGFHPRWRLTSCRRVVSSVAAIFNPQNLAQLIAMQSFISDYLHRAFRRTTSLGTHIAASSFHLNH